MQPRQQPLSEPGPRAPGPLAPLLALLLLLALQGTGAAPTGLTLSDGPEDYEWPEEDYEWPSHWPFLNEIMNLAARAAVHFLNFRTGSPSAVRVLSWVYRVSTWETPRKERHVVVSFTTRRYNSEEDKKEPLNDCSAEVIFREEKPRPSVDVTCEPLLEKSGQQQEDYLLYKHLKQFKPPLGAVSIPDSHGHIDPSLRPLWDLAILGSSYVMWDKTTHTLQYYLVQLTGVKQWKTDDSEIDFDYTVLLHEFSTQEIIPCRIHLVWYPGKPLKVKYRCGGPQTPDDASETEEGSAAAPTGLSNF